MDTNDTKNQLFEFLLELSRWGVVIVLLLGLVFAIKRLGLNILEPVQLPAVKQDGAKEKKA